MRFLLRLSCLALVVMVFSLPGLAQTPEEDSIKYTYTPITVLGTRTSQPWIEIPTSISFVKAKDMHSSKGYGLDEALAFVPGVLAQSRYGNQDVRLTIRGFGARGAGERSNSGTSRGIRIMNNGFPDTEPDGRTSLDLIDIPGSGGMEILRSNSSSLYGNAAGGVVNIHSNTTFASPYTMYGQSFGSYGYHREHITMGADLGGSKMYLSAFNTTSDGWRQHSQSSQLLFSTGIVAPVGERTNLGVHLSGTGNAFRIPGALTKPQYDSLASQSDSLYITRDERRNNRLGRLGVTADHGFDDHNSISGTAFVQPKYLERSERGTYRNFTRYHVGGSAMYRNASEFGDNIGSTFIAGIDEAYQDGAILFYTLSPTGGRDLPLRDNKREGANNFGGFLQEEIALGNWIFLLGARYDNITYYSESYIDLKFSEHKSFERVTPKAGITYRLSPSHSIYASLGGGVEVPAGNETDPAPTGGADTIYAINPLLDPMTSTTVELGTKQVMGIGGGTPSAYLTYDVAAYWIQVKDDIIPYRNGRFYFTAGKTERMGAEAGAELAFTMGLSVRGALTVSSNEYKNYIVDSVHYGVPGKTVDYSGNKVVGVPDVFYSVGLKYAPPSLSTSYVGLTLQTVGDFFADDANTISVPGSTVLNGVIGIERLDIGMGGFYISAFAGLNNLTDVKYIASAWLNPDIIDGEPVYIEPGLPSNFVGNISIGIGL